MSNVKKKILVLQGGNNEEHKVSLETGKQVKKALVKIGYKTQVLNVNPKTFIKDIKKYDFDICFNALHGSFGEDGRVQKILTNLKIPFTHSGITASYTAFNKVKTKKNLIKKNISYLNSKIISKKNINRKELIKYLAKYKSYVIKPIQSGSSYGVLIVKSLKEIDLILKKKNELYKKYNNLMIEPYIKGRELTVSVIEKNDKSRAVEVTEILSNNYFFDYKAKYTKGFSKHILPARLERKVYNRCLDYAKIAHDVIGCSGISRSDFIYDDKNNKLFFLEINTQPGLTAISLLPEQLKYKGIDFIDLINLLVKLAKCRK